MREQKALQTLLYARGLDLLISSIRLSVYDLEPWAPL